MVANRVNPNQEDEGKGAAKGGAAESAAPAAAQASSPVKDWLPLILAIVLMPVLAYATTTYLLLPKLQKAVGGGGEPAAAAEAAPKASGHGEAGGGEKKGGGEAAASSGPHKEIATMTKLLVNVAGTMGARYLLTSVTLVGSAPDFKSKIEQHDAQLKDLACGILSTKTIVDLEKPGARNLIRSELLSGFNNVLGGSTVHEIYFTEFAIQ